jgi:pimeloyl-ACP methyl ester carboxylesterase
MSTLKTIQTKVLEITFLDEGPAAGWPVILAHGFPYDVHAFDEVVPQLTRAGARVIAPYLRGFGPTRFLSKDSMRTGQQAALGQDLIDLLTLLAFNAPFWPATIGAAFRPVSPPLCGQNA